MNAPSGPDQVLDVVGIGFGPANLALAIALSEGSADARTPTTAFFERQPEFGWHRGMLIEDATMQVSFLKDLATMRDPTSPFTFVNYLHAKGRLNEFVNGKILYPLRVEFHDYLEWAADRFTETVSYDTDIVSLEPEYVDGVIESVAVRAQVMGIGERTVARARNVVIGTGLVPHLPPGIQASERVIHNSNLLHHLEVFEPAPRRVVVIGAGQSAAETADFLHGAFPDADVYAVFAKYGYSVADDSPFANRIFDAAAVDEFHIAPDSIKEMLLERHASTNYSVVDMDLAMQLYGKFYREQISGRRRLHIVNMSRIRDLSDDRDAVLVNVESLATRAVQTISADLVVFATGYLPHDPRDLLTALAGECKHDDAGRLVLDREYRAVTSRSMACQIFVQGPYAEHTHGLSAGLLSNVATRAAEIARAIGTGHHADHSA